jgi:hypothetical protein
MYKVDVISLKGKKDGSEKEDTQKGQVERAAFSFSFLPLNTLYEESESVVPGQEHSSHHFIDTYDMWQA